MRGKIKDTLGGMPGFKMSLAADVVEVWLEGKQGAYRIDLDLPWAKIQGLLEHAKGRLAGRPDM